MVKLPNEKIVSGDGWSAMYVFKERDYTDETLESEVRKRTSLSVNTDPLATPSMDVTLEGTDTQVILSLTAAQTRSLQTGAYLDFQIVRDQPLTIFQQFLEVSGDITK